MSELNREKGMLDDLCELWGVEQEQILPTGERIFKEYKKQGNTLKTMT